MIERRGRLEPAIVVVLPEDAEGEFPQAPSPSKHPTASIATAHRLIFDTGILLVTPGILAQLKFFNADSSPINGGRPGRRPTTSGASPI